MNFREEWDKLKNLKVGDEITAMRWNDYPVVYGQNIIIKLEGKIIAKGHVDRVGRSKMENLPTSFIQKDTYADMSRVDFFHLMWKFYRNKPNWNGWNSLVKLYFITITEII